MAEPIYQGSGALPYGNINAQVASAYTPYLTQGIEEIQRQGTQATSDMYGALASRGMLSSGLLPGGISDIASGTQRAIGGLYSQILPQMTQQSMAIDEARRQEDEAKKWGIFNMAMKFLSPLVMAPIYGAAFNIGQSMLPQGNNSTAALSSATLPSTDLSSYLFQNAGQSSPGGLSIYNSGYQY